MHVNTVPYGRRMNQKLGKQEWIRAGLRALAEQGAEAVRVERLATALGVTKGSFYWHFKDRGELLAALIEVWREQATDAIIAQVEAIGGSAGQKMRSLFTIVVSGDGRLDQAIRVWAASDANARAALALVDQRRLDYLASLFEQLGFTSNESGARGAHRGNHRDGPEYPPFGDLRGDLPCSERCGLDSFQREAACHRRRLRRPKCRGRCE